LNSLSRICGVDSRYGRLCLLLVLTLARPGLSRNMQRADAVKTLTKEVAMGPGLSRFSDSCLVFAALLSADDFFEGLEVRQSPAGREYRKGSHLVTEFPARVKVTVLTWVWKFGTDDAENPELATAILEKLHFEAKWKTGMKTRPVKELSSNFRQPSAQEWKERPDIKKFEKLGLEPRDPAVEGIWIFELTIKDEQVPLTDSLIVTVSSSDGRQIARFSGRL